MKKFLTIILLLVSFHSFSQTLTITGTVLDTSAKLPLPNAVAMAIRMKDSILVKFIRTDNKGFFKLDNFPIDTYQVIISHTGFGDKVFYVLGSKKDSSFDFGRFTLPAKSVSLKEVVIYAHKDPVYYNGDTLVYQADSFKTRANATVEDLLKKLPGIKVDAQGKITANGKAVDQVLVDGDEFFGSDPTVATRNLNADNVQSVQVYDKPKDNSSADGNTDPQKVMNLKLKDDAKKGYFGKVSVAGDFNKFYEGEALVNKFQGNQKISFFALSSNTPSNSINFSDAYKYGFQDQLNSGTDDEGNTYYYGSPSEKVLQGIPRTFKTGIYYANKFGKNTKLTANYTYTNGTLATEAETNSQYFFPDTTYSTTTQVSSFQRNQNHSANVNVAQTIDTLTDLYIGTKFSYMPGNDNTNTITNFISHTDSLSRSTTTNDNNQGDAYSASARINLKKRFKKKDRLLNITLYTSLGGNNSQGILQSHDYYYTLPQLNDSINESKKTSNNNQTYTAAAKYTEPLSKRLKLELSYDAGYSIIKQNIQTFDFVNGEYNSRDSSLSDQFETKRYSNRAAAAFIYEKKKQRITIGAAVRNVQLDNVNIANGSTINQSVNNVLPYFYYTYSFNDSRRLGFSYYTSSTQPSINQLQPVPNNTNPNYITVGNPSLLPNYKQDFSLYYYSYKAITGNNTYCGIDFASTNNDFSNSVSYDSLGRTITQTVNVNGDYSMHGNANTTIPLFSRLLQFNPYTNYSYSSNKNFIDNASNTTRITTVMGGINLTIQKDGLYLTMGGNYTYNLPYSTLNTNNQVYSTQDYYSTLQLDLPQKFRIESNFNYAINQQRAVGYDVNYFVWNASLARTFFKRENFIIAVSVNDLLNQNIAATRTVQDNVITDEKTNAVGRYLLLKAVYIFNSNKQKAENNDNGY